MTGEATLTVFSTPPSLNRVGGHSSWRTWRRHKKAWEADLGSQLMYQQVPRGLTKVTAEARLTFPLQRRRDEGNFRALLEKALGDALVAGGWLADDTDEFFRFGAVRFAVERGASRTEVLLRYERNDEEGE